MNSSVSIIDYGLGNIFNLIKSFEELGSQTKSISDPELIMKSDKIILPGVGAYIPAMQELKKTGMLEAIIEFHKTGKPILGICLGMQLLFESSTEFVKTDGIGLLNGHCYDMREKILDNTVKIPRISWDKLELLKDSVITHNLKNNDQVYFIHSFAAKVDQDQIIASSKFNELDVPSIVEKDNLFGCQFHPEKSGIIGKIILNNFLRINL